MQERESVAALLDRIAYWNGPVFGFRVHTSPRDGQEYAYAITGNGYAYQVVAYRLEGPFTDDAGGEYGSEWWDFSADTVPDVARGLDMIGALIASGEWEQHTHELPAAFGGGE